MATETRGEALRSFTTAIATFVLVAAASFAWAAIESQKTSAAHGPEIQTAAAPSP